MKIQYDFFSFFLRDLVVCMKTKHFNFFLMFWQKPGFLILDLYLYNIKIQTNIDQNSVKYLRKIIIFFKKIIFEIIYLFIGGWAQQA